MNIPSSSEVLSLEQERDLTAHQIVDGLLRRVGQSNMVILTQELRETLEHYETVLVDITLAHLARANA